MIHYLGRPFSVRGLDLCKFSYRPILETFCGLVPLGRCLSRLRNQCEESKLLFLKYLGLREGKSFFKMQRDKRLE